MKVFSNAFKYSKILISFSKIVWQNELFKSAFFSHGRRIHFKLCSKLHSHTRTRDSLFRISQSLVSAAFVCLQNDDKGIKNSGSGRNCAAAGERQPAAKDADCRSAKKTADSTTQTAIHAQIGRWKGGIKGAGKIVEDINC